MGKSKEVPQEFVQFSRGRCFVRLRGSLVGREVGLRLGCVIALIVATLIYVFTCRTC